MIDYTAKGEEEKKRSGCLVFFVALIVILLIGAGALYFALPRILMNPPDILPIPEGIQNQQNEISSVVRENLQQINKLGLDNYELASVIEEIDFSTAENIIEDLYTRQVRNTNEAIQVLEENLDLSGINLDRIKEEYYSEISPEDLKRIKEQFDDNPLMIRAGFGVLKETVLNLLYETESIEVEQEVTTEPEPEAERKSSTTKKKK